MVETRSKGALAPRQGGFTLVEILVVLVVIMVVAAIALSIGYHAFDSARLGRSIADLRAISAAVQKYKLDYATIPAGGLQPVANVAPTLQAVARDIPTSDGWGNEFYYQDVVTAGGTTYRLFCYGKDGAYDGVVSGNWVDFYSDTVVEGGIFVQSKY
jgi:general secretion pathway protein G